MEKEETAVVCPYDKNHIIHKSRLQRHLIRCAKNFPPKFKETCPFNATHLMFASDLEKHIQECPDRKYIETERYRYTLKNHGSIASCQQSYVDLTVDDNETWDLASTRDDFSTIESESICGLPVRKETSTQPGRMRAPFTQSQVMLMNIPSEDARAEDLESVTSSVGRGKFIKGGLIVQKIGRGRGNFSCNTPKVGASALADTEDTESVVSSIGRGMIHHRVMSDSRYASDMEDMISVVSSVRSRYLS
ncbi:uncharacterized protein [Chelonus insularis]|uniref:uncharacterized protein n=1 Tax=Chelonus insularis TaxID=460826 RepID=UPI001589139C|nr:uncharacterized protein LOC118073247 [Chelonus insularis]